jgi:phosphoserine phosphatase
VYEGFLEAVNNVRSISAFDLDHTLLSDNTSYRFCLYLCKKKYLPLSSLAFIFGCNIRHSLGVLSIVGLHESAFSRLFKGRSSLTIKQWAFDFLDEYLDSFLYEPAIKKLKEAQSAGHFTAILSSSPDFLVEPIAKRLEIPFWKSTRYAVDKENKFSHIAELMQGSDKAKIIGELSSLYHVPKKEITAYSDSHLDLPFLMAAGTSYGVNPNRKLRSLCQKNNWSII